MLTSMYFFTVYSKFSHLFAYYVSIHTLPDSDINLKHTLKLENDTHKLTYIHFQTLT